MAAAIRSGEPYGSSPKQETPPATHGARSPTETDFLAGLLRAVLSSDASFSAVGDVSSPLPAQFSAALLREDEHEAARVEVSVREGLPAYPLYKHVASALVNWVVTSTFPRVMEPLSGIAESQCMTAKIDEWGTKVLPLGSYLVESGRGVALQLHVQEPYFSQLKGGTKTVEGRCAGGAYDKLQAGDTLLFNQALLLMVEDVKHYKSFEKMLEAEGLDRVLPGIPTIREGVQVYRIFYSEAREKAGVIGIHVCHPSGLRQPAEVLHDLLKALGKDGVRTLLGMRSTVGSIDDAVPPPASALSSSFSAVQHETLPGSMLTVGARALAKHVHRSSSGWWGGCTGTEPDKNELALRKLWELLDTAVWMNTHQVPTPVFEIRVGDGYGARWSADGSQFRGFLEPPMDEGYLKRWRH